jgi:hypothetical protein
MTNYQVSYSGGESRENKNSIDYMLVVIDEIEIYFEVPPTEDSYDILKEKVIEKAKEYGVAELLVF